VRGVRWTLTTVPRPLATTMQHVRHVTQCLKVDKLLQIQHKTYWKSNTRGCGYSLEVMWWLNGGDTVTRWSGCCDSFEGMKLLIGGDVGTHLTGCCDSFKWMCWLIWWIIWGIYAAHLRGCGGSFDVMWCINLGDVVDHFRGCDGSFEGLWQLWCLIGNASDHKVISYV